MAIWNRKESKVGKLKKSEEEKRERRFRGVGFLIFFISVQGSAEREYFKRGRGRFPFCKIERELEEEGKKAVESTAVFYLLGRKESS